MADKAKWLTGKAKLSNLQASVLYKPNARGLL
jgi:hypothetical protein